MGNERVWNTKCSSVLGSTKDAVLLGSHGQSHSETSYFIAWQPLLYESSLSAVCIGTLAQLEVYPITYSGTRTGAIPSFVGIFGRILRQVVLFLRHGRLQNGLKKLNSMSFHLCGLTGSQRWTSIVISMLGNWPKHQMAPMLYSYDG